MNKNLLVLFCAIILSLVSCNRDEESSIEKLNPASVNVYIAGAENGKACYWKNGQKFNLPNGDNLYARQIIVENNNIYVLGGIAAEFNPINNNNPRIYLWINGVRNDLETYLNLSPNLNSNNDQYKLSNKMRYDNGNLYFFGRILNPNSTSSQDFYQICYWKNTSKTVVTTASSSSQLFYNILVFNNDVYSTIKDNYNFINGNYTWDSEYYKNSSLILTENTTHQRNFFRNNVGVFSTSQNLTTNLFSYRNLTNNINTQIPISIQNELISLTGDGNDFYYVGKTYYYKNNVLYQLNDPNGFNLIGGEIKFKNSQMYSLRYDNPSQNAAIFANDVQIFSRPVSAIGDPNFSTILDFYITD